ncbi:amidohydrolase [Pseudalkalibacillus hwajinpoensis]|uniref:amidohydrolase n=1 Tax=Guptibacillus hwajinpoensis TaxID=208199 RepID=UPI00325A66BB
MNKADCNKLDQYIRNVQEDLHRIPEPAFKEEQTASYIARELKRMGYFVKTGIAGTGVTATMPGKKNYPCVAVRADMDCITHEDGGKITYRHSCGHDAHSSIALGIAKHFSENREAITGSIVFIFQPAEEIMQGAKAMTDEGVLKDVDVLIGYHLRTEEECPMGSMAPALMHSATTIVSGEIKGKTAHGGRPHHGVNVIDVMATLLSAVNTIRSNPQSGTSITFTRISAGGGSLNVIPGSATFALDIRSRDNEELNRVISNLDSIFQNCAAMHDAKITYSIEGAVPAPRYSGRLIEEARESIEAVLGKGKAIPPIVTPGGEDFHYYTALSDVEAVYLGIGANVSPGLHDPAMTFEKKSLVDAVQVVSHLMGQLMKQK